MISTWLPCDDLLMFPKFTPRELEIMSWTAQGKNRAEISIILSISEATVKTHLGRACRKLNAVNKTQAIALAISHGVIMPTHAVGACYGIAS
ncbi:MAG: helix-turn-helix transcriptional regulator [Bdellovibrionales bacterium]